LLRLWKKELCNQEISVPSANTPAARDISGIGKDRLSTEEARPFPKPEPMCNRRQTKEEGEVSHFNRFSFKDGIEQEGLTRAAIKKKYCKGAKKRRNKKNSRIMLKK
jgi:hypothetical protein